MAFYKKFQPQIIKFYKRMKKDGLLLSTEYSRPTELMLKS